MTEEVIWQAAAGSDVGNLPESSTTRPAIDLAASASDQPSLPPSTAGDALLAAQLQEEDQVATQAACDLYTKHRTEQQMPTLLLQIDACTVCTAPWVPGIFISMHA